MSTLEERAPGFFMTPTEREALSDLLAKAERISADLADAYREAQRILTGTTDLDPSVDLGDPLAMYRLPSGSVGYVEVGARWVTEGGWVQAIHGDEGRWERVVGIVPAESLIGLTTDMGDGTRLRWWGYEDRVRVAMTPAQVVAGQERTADRIGPTP